MKRLGLKTSIINKLYLGCVVLLVLPVILLTSLSFSTFRQSIITLSEKRMYDTLATVEKSISAYFDKIKNVTFAIYKERVSYGFIMPTALDYLSSESVFTPNQDWKGPVLTAFLERLIDYEPDSILTVFFVEKSNDIYYAKNQTAKIVGNYGYDFTAQPWFLDIKTNQYRRMQLVPGGGTHMSGFYKVPPKNLYSVARNIYQVDNRLHVSYLGTLVLNLDGQYFSRFFDSLDLDANAFYIFDHDNKVIFNTESEISLDEILRAKNAADGNTITIGKDKYNFVHTTFGEYGVSVVGITNINVLTQAFDNIRDFTIVTVFVFLLLSFFSLRVLNQSVAVPVNIIKENIAMVENGRFDDLRKIRARNEFSDINDGLIIAAGNTKEYINKAYVAQLKKKSADLYALQSQIKPHFIMNVLETIRMNLVAREDARNARAVMLLGRFTREHLARNDQMVTLRDEAELAKSYMEIMSYCYNSAVELQIDIPEGLLDHRVLKMVLQPIVENSVRHGFVSGGVGGYIKVNAYLTVSGLRLMVMDNGGGICPEKLIEIHEELERDEVNLDSTHVGLKNVQDRLKNYYGPQAKLSISSVFSEGTIVHLDIPETV